MPAERPDLSLLDDVVAPRILDAMRASSQFLRENGIKHVLVGGLAVGAYGHPRATKDVDFLVGDNAFEHHGGGIVTMRAPIQVNGVAVDHVSVGAGETFLTDLLHTTPQTEGTPVVPLEALVYMKLKAGRAQDVADLVALIKSEIDLEACRAWLSRNAPQFLPKLAHVEAQARAEQ